MATPLCITIFRRHLTAAGDAATAHHRLRLQRTHSGDDFGMALRNVWLYIARDIHHRKSRAYLRHRRGTPLYALYLPPVRTPAHTGFACVSQLPEDARIIRAIMAEHQRSDNDERMPYTGNVFSCGDMPILSAPTSWPRYISARRIASIFQRDVYCCAS